MWWHKPVIPVVGGEGEGKAGRPGVQGHLQQHSQFQASLLYKRPCLQINNKNKATLNSNQNISHRQREVSLGMEAVEGTGLLTLGYTQLSVGSLGVPAKN